MDWLLKQVDLQRNVLNSSATENGLKFRCKIQPCQWQLVFIFLSPHFGNITSLNNKMSKLSSSKLNSSIFFYPFLCVFDPKQPGWFQRSTLTQIASKLDEHMSVLVEGLNTSLVSCAKLRSRRWCLWEDMGQWNQEELVISGLIHNLPSRLYIDPIQSGETLNVNWFVWDTYEF